jgi:hypothetical protein
MTSLQEERVEIVFLSVCLILLSVAQGAFARGRHCNLAGFHDAAIANQASSPFGTLFIAFESNKFLTRRQEGNPA